MIQSLLKILFFFAVVLALALGAERIAATGEPVRIVFEGVEYTLGPLQAVVVAILLLIVAWLLMKLVGFVLSLLGFALGERNDVDRWFDRRRQQKGYAALSEGMLAVASGEGRLAQDQAAKAARYLDQPHLTNLLAAQAAEVAGDATAADSAYRRMLEDDRTRFVGIRGLMQQRLRQGDTQTALKLAEKAYAIRPRNIALQDQLLSLQAQAHDWKGARGVLKDKRRRGDLPKDVHIRRDAVLALQEAREVLAHGNSISAREAAISANRASPDLIPAAVLAARSYIARKDPKNAARVLEKTWGIRPHPSLAAAYAEIAPEESPSQRLRRFQPLLKQQADDPETRMLHAELLLAAEDFPGARRALGDLAEKHPTVRSLAIMAAIARGEGADESLVRGWLARAMTASRGPQWVCDNCHNVMEDWAPTCDSCNAFDTLTWREPDRHLEAASPYGVEMLPLIVGRPAGSEAHVAAAFHEADAYAEGSDHHPSATPDPGLRPAPAAPRSSGPVRETPVVPPGIVPRESDYVASEPSRTVTDLEEEPLLVRPDVEPPDEGPENTQRRA
ncbi:heme biosynthesis protein HemY [Paracoccus sp. S-4012]|uniref:heme biosynthesis protein HemY n=1 Tax=Paracoccus sp. S-4012 TaxID=2665648 RepID=UPI0012AF750A|nr:heme biosynthesis HemY N-terminal domain-containing protein [Paracoccus sp. S-4012]MRX49646.1 heme biosynthesis protein HemY [Paracoccus sp. S-4012]